MDSQRFDEISRRLAGGTTRRGALAALVAAGLGLGAGFGAREAEAKNKKKRKRCDPACAEGQTCDKATRTCRCDNGGTVCGANCCAIGQACQGGQCVAMPEPGQCAALGATCKDTGVPCCDGLTCASGQGGQGDVACHVPAGGACATTTDCVWFAACEDGVCVDRQPQPGPDPGGICTVCPSGCKFATIEAAIAAAASGETITVKPGTYAPNATGPTVYMTIAGKTVTVKSCDPQGVVTVDCPDLGSGFSACFYVSGNGELDIDGFAFTSGAKVASFSTAIGVADGKARIANVSTTGFTNPILAAQGGADITIGSGVALMDWHGQGASAGLAVTLGPDTITCTTPVTFSGPAPDCKKINNAGTIADCGCTP